MAEDHIVAKETSAAVFGLLILVFLIAADFSLLGVGQRRRVSDAWLVRVLYTTYFILFGYLMHWVANGFAKQCLPDGTCVVTFQYHPLFMSIAWVFFASEGIMAYKVKPMSKSSHATSKAYHAIMNFLALVFAITGVAIAFRNHQVKGVAHLDSVHSWIGFTTTWIMFIQFVVGLYVYYFSSNKGLKQDLMMGHRFVGGMSYVLAVATISLGLLNYEGDGHYTTKHKVIQVAIVVLWAQALHVIGNLISA
eukprot:TRINITY_DN7538_c0_g1_i1.p1 TRINITY_DN7538_c0_g1~~TRINITY_DN7538_c0_g1_i1.p1  ORF type:complete len:250 (+),score=15.16 TRINITY_DN7538_c0_g1_i1:182-931(+)